jgi:hypothetical protein
MSKASKKVRVQAQAPAQAPAPTVETTTTAPAAPETPAAETPAPETAKVVKIRYAKRDWAPTDVITLLQPANPKTGASKARYALYKDGMLVSEYAAAVVGLGGKNTKTLANADLRWDVARGFITIAPKAS